MLTTVGGLAIAGWAIGATGLVEILRAAGRIGVGGFLIYCLWSLGVFGLLGAAWLAAAPGEPVARLPLFAWARMVREAASDLLPFSQLGGLVLSARTLATGRMASPRVYGSLVVDMTTEMAGQLVYTLFGLALMASLLAGDGAASMLRPMILGGTLVMIAIMLAFFSMQRAALNLASAVAARFLPQSSGGVAAIREELARIYGRHGHVLLAFLFNLLGWIASGMGAWIVLHLMGIHLSIWDVLSLESVIFTLRSVAFFVPGAIGVQEAGYALLGQLFGLPPESALALSLAKRAREIALGIPTLLLWQMGEMRAVAARS